MFSDTNAASLQKIKVKRFKTKKKKNHAHGINKRGRKTTGVARQHNPAPPTNTGLLLGHTPWPTGEPEEHSPASCHSSPATSPGPRNSLLQLLGIHWHSLTMAFTDNSPGAMQGQERIETGLQEETAGFSPPPPLETEKGSWTKECVRPLRCAQKTPESKRLCLQRKIGGGEGGTGRIGGKGSNRDSMKVCSNWAQSQNETECGFS